MNKGVDRNRLLSWSYFLFLSFVWGSSFILMKKALIAFTAFQVASLRLITAFSIMAGFAFFHVRNIPTNKFRYILPCSLLSMFIPSYLFCFAQQKGLDSSVAGILNALTPLFTFLIGVFAFRQKVLVNKIIGLIIGLAGTFFLVLINSKGKTEINYNAFFVMATAICYGMNINLVKQYLSDIDPLHLTTVAVSISGLIALPVLFLSSSFPDLIHSVATQKIPFCSVLILGVLGTAFTQLALNRLIKLTSPVFASSNTYVIPVVAVLWGVGDGETLLAWHYVGIALIISGAFILNKR